ncbi:carbohydrate ABC transporter permease [Nonomuraea sp. NPDC050153]|uniref:carbohydrate ABC transporter permease n=1 Tax=Nonomuraea sp. NPDC050153 TaxID=3364359 RepID=UPI00379A2D59
MTMTTAARKPRAAVPARPGRVRDSRVDRLFMVAVHVLLVTFLAVVLVPLIYIVASSLSSADAVSSGRVTLWPVDFSLRGYEVALSDPQIVTGFANSLFYTVVGTLISVTLTIAIAYPLSRKDFFGRNLITRFIVFTMLFAGGVIPTYLVVKSLGMIDTRWALIVPNAIGVWQVIIARTYLRHAIPEELYEAAELDGASDLRVLWSVVLPLAKPMIAVIALVYAIAQWNSYFDALIYLKNDDLYPLQLVLRNILILNTQGDSSMDVATMLERQQMADLLKYSLIVISTVPVLLIYPFVARHFTKGVMLGALKG